MWVPPLIADRMFDLHVSHVHLDRQVSRRINDALCENQLVGNAPRMMRTRRRKLMIEAVTESPGKPGRQTIVVFVSAFWSVLPGGFCRALAYSVCSHYKERSQHQPWTVVRLPLAWRPHPPLRSDFYRRWTSVNDGSSASVFRLWNCLLQKVLGVS